MFSLKKTGYDNKRMGEVGHSCMTIDLTTHNTMSGANTQECQAITSSGLQHKQGCEKCVESGRLHKPHSHWCLDQ